MNIQDITQLILHYQYLIMFLLMFLEGPIIGFISAFLAAQGFFDFWIVYILSVAGDVTGDLMWYRIGRFGRRFSIIKHIEKLHKERNSLSKQVYSQASRLSNWLSSKIHILEKSNLLKYLERKAKTNFFVSLLIVKITPPLSIPGQFSFGFLKISFWRFLLQTTLVCFLFESIFLNLGYFSSISAKVFKDRFDTGVAIISTICVAIIALLIGFFIVKRFRHISKRLK